jgi:murein DD-endopeptidase MepM/ murein hydrolase activator NlpD
MRKKIAYISIAALRKTLESLSLTLPKIVKSLAILALPFLLLWKLVQPLVIQFYKLTIIVRKNAGQFFHAQHKILALVTANSTVHIFMVGLMLSIVWINIGYAQEVRAEEFLSGSVINNILNPNSETVITTDPTKITRNSYIDASSAVRARPQIDTETDIATAAELIAANNGGAAKTTAGAIQSATIITGGATGSNKNIQQYEVKGGDTIGSISKAFGISQATILSANNLDEDTAKRVKPGDTLYILPVSGVAHTVQAGETAQQIAEKYSGSKAEEILAYNKIIGDSLEAGVEIIVPNGTRPAPTKPAETAPASSGSRFARVGGSSSSGIITSTVSNAPAPNATPSGGKFQWPTTTRRISCYYGRCYGRVHTGLDIDGEFGDPIYAASGGRVVSAGWGGAYGIQIVIDHGGGVQTRYAHLQKLYVSAGQTVSRGQTIGQEGSTGNSSGSHLHYEVIVGGRTVNPFSYH